mmetsp:Transcript_83217/g.101979  ORF Transcript_83217/g.101979 Transcript_83217/m.101979 type:complete len:290 (-) Transcript_83217:78-947(-)
MLSEHKQQEQEPLQQQQPTQATQQTVTIQTGQPIQTSSKSAKKICFDIGNIFPLDIMGFISGIVLIGSCILDLFIVKPLTFTQIVIMIPLIFGGLILMLVDLSSISRPNSSDNSMTKIQLILYEWIKILSRMWGRCIVNFILIIICFSEINQGFQALPYIAGIYLIIMLILYFIFGKLAALKYNKLYQILITSKEQFTDTNNSSNTDNTGKSADEIVMEIGNVYDELDTNKNGKLTLSELKLLSNTHNISLTTGEAMAIKRYLDIDCNGYISRDNWVKMWFKKKHLIWL